MSTFDLLVKPKTSEQNGLANSIPYRSILLRKTPGEHDKKDLIYSTVATVAQANMILFSESLSAWSKDRDPAGYNALKEGMTLGRRWVPCGVCTTQSEKVIDYTSGPKDVRKISCQIGGSGFVENLWSSNLAVGDSMFLVLKMVQVVVPSVEFDIRPGVKAVLDVPGELLNMRDVSIFVPQFVAVHSQRSVPTLLSQTFNMNNVEHFGVVYRVGVCTGVSPTECRIFKHQKNAALSQYEEIWVKGCNERSQLDVELFF